MLQRSPTFENVHIKIKLHSHRGGGWCGGRPSQPQVSATVTFKLCHSLVALIDIVYELILYIYFLAINIKATHSTYQSESSHPLQPESMYYLLNTFD